MVLDSAGMFGRQVDWRQHAWWSHSAACILLSKTDPIFHLSCMILSRVQDPTAVPFWIHFGENVQRLLCVLQDCAEVDTRCRHQAVLSHMSVIACSIFMCFMSSLITLLFYSSLISYQLSQRGRSVQNSPVIQVLGCHPQFLLPSVLQYNTFAGVRYVFMYAMCPNHVKCSLL